MRVLVTSLSVLFVLTACISSTPPEFLTGDADSIISWGTDTNSHWATDISSPDEQATPETTADTQPEADTLPPYEPPDGFEVIFLDVGQGDSILLRFPAGSTMLVDGGNKSAGPAVILPYFDDIHLTQLDYLVVTHPDADHCGGLDDVVYGVDVGEVWENGQVADTWAWWDFSDAVDDEGVPRLVVVRGDEETIDGCEVEV